MNIPQIEHVLIRRARLPDAALLASIADSWFRDAFAAQNDPAHMNAYCAQYFGIEQQTAELQDPNMIALIADDADGPVAFAQLLLGSRPASELDVGIAPVELQRFYVKRGYHGAGVARLLMDRCFAEARERAADTIWLGVWQNNARAIAFYHKCGYDIVGEQVFMLGPEPQQDHIMVRKLSPLAEPNIIRDVSDTARFVAAYRARETDRPNALFRDPYARRLAGPRGENMRAQLDRFEWPFIVRTVVFDEFIQRSLQAGTDVVVNLGAGLDARPYRMNLPRELHWFEVDQPQMIDYKEKVLGNEQPRCRLTRIGRDLTDRPARQQVLRQIAEQARQALIITEGLLVYLEPTHAAELADDLRDHHSFRRWITDLGSPGLLHMLQRRYQPLHQASPLRFAPADGVGFFEKHGWQPVEIRPALQEAAKLRRVSWLMRLFARIHSDPYAPGKRLWSANILLERSA